MNCTGKQCIMQFDKVDPSTCKCVSYCPQATPPKTNGDRIRSMSDEELAVQIADWVSGDCPSIDFCPKPRNDVTHKVECIPWKCWLDWLKQEATE